MLSRFLSVGGSLPPLGTISSDRQRTSKRTGDIRHVDALSVGQLFVAVPEYHFLKGQFQGHRARFISKTWLIV